MRTFSNIVLYFVLLLLFIVPVCAAGQSKCSDAKRLIKESSSSDIQFSEDLEKKYIDAINLCPTFAEAIYNLGVLYYKKGDFTAAEKYIHRSLSLKDDIRFRSSLALVYIKLNKLIDAEKVYLEILSAHDKNSKALQGVSIVYDALGKKNEALKTIEKARSLDPQNEDLIFNAALLYEKYGTPKTAIDLYQLLVNKDGSPLATKSRFYLANIYCSQKMFIQCQEQISKVLESEPQNIEALKLGATVALQLSQLSEAESLYKKAISLKPQDIQLYLQLAATLIKDNQFENALTILQDALTKFAENAELYAMIGNAHLSLLHFDKAREAFEKSLVFDASQQAVHFNLALALQSQGKKSEAEEHFSIAEKLKEKREYSTNKEYPINK
jgi:Flp pilus assembly protein TadD